MLAPKTLTTQADQLLELVKQQKEIPMSAAAKMLGASQNSVEKWANFLEEEKVLAIHYKFTTPYLVYVGQQNEGGSQAEPIKLFIDKPQLKSDLQTSLSEYEKKLNELKLRSSTGDFEHLKSSYPSILEGLHTFTDRIARFLKEPNNARQEEIKKRLKSVERPLSKAHSYAEKGRFDLANQIYSKINEELSDVFDDIKRAYEEAPPHRQRQAEQFKDVQTLLNKAYEYMMQGDTERAKVLYDQLKSFYARLPDEYMQRKLAIEKHLIKLNKDLFQKINQKTQRDTKVAAARIMQLIKEARSAILAADFERAETSYELAKQEFYSLPEGFYDEKRLLHQSLLELFDNLIATRNKAYEIAFAEKRTHMETLLSQMKAGLSAKDVNSAIDTYKEIKAIFSSLPPGFFKEKLVYQKKILSEYQELSAAYQQTYSSLLKQELQKINRLLQNLLSHLSRNELSLAEKAYLDAKSEFSKIPDVFLVEKSDLQIRLLHAYADLVKISEAQLSKEFSVKQRELQLMLRDAHIYLKQRKFDIAEQFYLQMVQAYNRLPPGFLEEKMDLRNNILALYRDIVLNVDQPFLQKHDIHVSDTYQEMLKALLEIHNKIAHREFDLIIDAYDHAERLYKSLPVGFVQERNRIGERIKTVGMEVSLYKDLKEAERLVTHKDFAGMSAQIASIKNRIDVLIRKLPEDAPLFEYITQRIDDISGSIPVTGLNQEQSKDIQSEQELPMEDPKEMEHHEIKSAIQRMKVAAKPQVRVL